MMNRLYSGVPFVHFNQDFKRAVHSVSPARLFATARTAAAPFPVLQRLLELAPTHDLQHLLELAPAHVQ